MHDGFPERETIERFYAGRSAVRSGLPYMNHVVEGLRVLDWIDASRDAKRAFCLHPLVQADDDLRQRCTPGDPFPIDSLTPSSRVLALAMEYRSVANGYLSAHGPRTPQQIRLSPLPEVNAMLVADKVQNYKDFLAHHEAHPRAADLDAYFRAWLERLGVTLETFEAYRSRLS